MNKATRISLLLLCLPLTGYANAPSWKVLPIDSTLTFTATQNNAPVKGKFTQYDGDIQFDPNDLKSSKVLLNVNTNSVDTPLKDIAETLKTPDWLSTTLFPKATFETVEISKQDDKNYTATGNLTIRDKTFPALVKFTVMEFSPERALVKGSASFKRTAYGVGQGEWANTNDIKDDVIIDFNLKLAPKS